jgi:hypothetical protein
MMSKARKQKVSKVESPVRRKGDFPFKNATGSSPVVTSPWGRVYRANQKPDFYYPSVISDRKGVFNPLMRIPRGGTVAPVFIKGKRRRDSFGFEALGALPSSAISISDDGLTAITKTPRQRQLHKVAVIDFLTAGEGDVSESGAVAFFQTPGDQLLKRRQRINRRGKMLSGSAVKRKVKRASSDEMERVEGASISPGMLSRNSARERTSLRTTFGISANEEQQRMEVQQRIDEQQRMEERRARIDEGIEDDDSFIFSSFKPGSFFDHADNFMDPGDAGYLSDDTVRRQSIDSQDEDDDPRNSQDTFEYCHSIAHSMGGSNTEAVAASASQNISDIAIDHNIKQEVMEGARIKVEVANSLVPGFHIAESKTVTITDEQGAQAKVRYHDPQNALAFNETAMRVVHSIFGGVFSRAPADTEVGTDDAVAAQAMSVS